MACYDVNAELVIRVLVELQVDAENKEDAIAQGREHLNACPPMVSDGAAYGVVIDSMNARRRRTK